MGKRGRPPKREHSPKASCVRSGWRSCGAARRSGDRSLEATAHHVDAYAADHDFARFIVQREQLRLPVEA